VRAAASVSIDFGVIDASFWMVGFDIELLIGQSAQWSYKVQLGVALVSSCGGLSVLLVGIIWRFCRFGHWMCPVVHLRGQHQRLLMMW
jgi:hypothetical protein